MKQSPFFQLIVLLLVLLPLATVVHKAQASDSSQLAMVFGSSGYVLGDDDSQEEHEEEEEEEDEQGQEHEEENEEEREDEQDQEHEDESEDSHTEETIRSANGSTTYIKRESNSEKTEVELKTYDANGKLIEERKLKQESEEGETKELELEQYVYNNGDLQELKIKSAEGRQLEITLREGEGKTSKIEYDVTKQKLKISDDEQGRELYISPENDHFLLHDGVQSAQIRLPLTVDVESGEIFIETAIGLIRVGISPDRAREIIQETQQDLLIKDDAISLEEGGNGLEYWILTQKQEHLLGLFPVTVDAIQRIDAETGAPAKTKQTLGASLLDLFSF